MKVTCIFDRTIKKIRSVIKLSAKYSTSSFNLFFTVDGVFAPDLKNGLASFIWIFTSSLVLMMGEESLWIDHQDVIYSVNKVSRLTFKIL